jgi:hypothetical protein
MSNYERRAHGFNVVQPQAENQPQVDKVGKVFRVETAGIRRCLIGEDMSIPVAAIQHSRIRCQPKESHEDSDFR